MAKHMCFKISATTAILAGVLMLIWPPLVYVCVGGVVAMFLTIIWFD